MQTKQTTGTSPQHELTYVTLLPIWRERKNITHSLQIQLGHEGITRLQRMLCMKIMHK